MKKKWRITHNTLFWSESLGMWDTIQNFHKNAHYEFSSSRMVTKKSVARSIYYYMSSGFEMFQMTLTGGSWQHNKVAEWEEGD